MGSPSLFASPSEPSLRSRFPIVAAALIVVGGLAVAGVRGAGSSDAAGPESPSADGDVSSFASANSVLYVGGSFRRLGTRAGQFAVVGRRSPVVLGGPVDAVVSDGRGGWFLGGGFTSVGGVSCPRLAHVRNDGGLDRRWCRLAVGGRIYSLALVGARLYVGGDFDAIAGRKRRATAALNVSTASLSSWDAGIAFSGGCGGGEEFTPGGATVEQLAPTSSTVILSGCFYHVGGAERRNGIAAVDTATGKPRPWRPALPDVGAWALSRSGKTVFMVGLWLDSRGSVTRRRLAAVDAQTGKVTRWYPTPNGPPASDLSGLTASGSTIYVGGDFTRIGGKPRRNVAAIDIRTGTISRWRPDPDGPVDQIVVAGGRVFLAGDFERVGGAERVGIAELDSRTGKATSWKSDASGSLLWSIGVSRSGIVALGFNEGGVRGPTRTGLAAIDTAAGRVTNWNPAPSGRTVEALTISGSTLYVAGRFEQIGGVARKGLAAIDLVTGEVTPWDPKIGGVWERIAATDRSVFVSRRFDGAGKDSPRLFAIDAAIGAVLPWKLVPPPGDFTRASMLIAGSTLFVAGSAPGRSGGYVRALDATTGETKALAVRLPEPVSSLAAADGTLYIATCCSGGDVRAVDASTGRLKWRSAHILTVEAMAIFDNVLYLGGLFDRINGQKRTNLAALDTRTGKLKAWRAEIERPVRGISALHVVGSRLHAGGDFDGHLASFPLAR